LAFTTPFMISLGDSPVNFFGLTPSHTYLSSLYGYSTFCHD
jgi:hypothetical protein